MTPSDAVPSPRPTKSSRTLDSAAKLVVEALEARVLLSGGAWTRLDALTAGDHDKAAVSASPSLLPVTGGYPRTSPTDLMPSGVIRGPGNALAGYTVNQMRQLYGWNNLSAPNPNFPLFSNSGDGQAICVVGAPTFVPGTELTTMNPAPPRLAMGNLQKFNMGEPVTSPSFGVQGTVQEEAAEDLSTNNDPSLFGAVETAMLIEWSHAFAPSAFLYAEYVNSSNGAVAPADLLVGIQAAIDTLEAIPETFPPPHDALPPGGVIVLSLSSAQEMAANQAQFDSVFSQARAANISFVCSAGDTGGIVATPAVSPFVTTVGGTTIRVDGAGNRLGETAALNAGGGQSTTEPLPAYQQGISLKKKLLTGGRAVPDVSLMYTSRSGGVSVYYDPTPTGSSMFPWWQVEGTSVGTAMFGGMVADANEMRFKAGMPLLGSSLNAKMYSAYQQNPTLYFQDITGGNNTLHSATKGFDLATGMGAPNMDTLIPALADIVVSVNSPVHFNGFLTAPLSTGLAGLGVTSYRGTGSIGIGPQFVSLNLNIVGNDGSTAALNVPQIDRALDNTLDATGTVTITSGTASFTLNIEVTGRVSRLTSRKPKVHGNIFTIDPVTGLKLKQGNNAIFQGSFGN
jgi:hypothetical protein